MIGVFIICVKDFSDRVILKQKKITEIVSTTLSWRKKTNGIFCKSYKPESKFSHSLYNRQTYHCKIKTEEKK